MFPRMNIANPFQSFSFGVPQYGAGVGIGGINPVFSHLTNPYASNPMVALSGIGVNPYIGPQALGLGQISPFLTQAPGWGQPHGWGQPQPVHPLLIAQLAATNPALLPPLAQHSVIGQSPHGVQSPLQFQPWQFGAPFQQFGAGIGQWGSPFNQGISPPLQPGFGYPGLQQGFGWGAPALFSNPVPGVDPVTGALISQQVPPLAQSQLPIRPLFTTQQPDPFQVAALSGVMTGQATDPYSVLAQSGLMAPLGVNPIYQAWRQQIGSPHSGIPI